MLATVRIPKSAAAASIQPWVNNSRRRRSTTSAIAPAGSASMKNGKLDAACIMAINSGEGESDVINHAAPTSCIQVPMLETAEASHRARNNGWARGLHMEAGFVAIALMFVAGVCAIGRYLTFSAITVFLILFLRLLI